MRICLIAAAIMLSACQLSLPGKPLDAPAVNPVATGEISVTSLDAAPEPTKAAVTEPAAAEPVPEPEAVAEPAPVAPKPAPKSSSQLTCEKKGGAWVAAGTTGTMSCQTPQRDGGKQCSRDSDCEGQCLARSRSCAPYAPLFGCNDVLQDNGQRVTLCIE